MDLDGPAYKCQNKMCSFSSQNDSKIPIVKGHHGICSRLFSVEEKNFLEFNQAIRSKKVIPFFPIHSDSNLLD